MKPTTSLRSAVVGAGSVLMLAALAMAGEGSPRTGPETEKRFPPLRVPPGFRATLFACDPLVEYPSAIAAGARSGSIFVAFDYLSGLRPSTERRDEIRLVEDTDGDGYADRAAPFAEGFHSIQGLAYHRGAVYVMHAPFLSVVRDRDGDGRADERRDLLGGLGLPPEKNPPMLHCANGVVVGSDGWLYLALGDHGCDVPRPEGDRLVLQGGGILRCRPDGRDLHVFATGLRNIYDVALDDELNVFVRDNENDGGDYMIRVAHSLLGADHGYPYLYRERPDEALPPLADLGRGSSAGGLSYGETAFPPEYRGNLFFCEWGRAVMRYRPERTGSTFAPLREVEFAAGAPDDPYGFKPTDLVAQRDGSLIVSDWADGQSPKRGRGRLYRIAPIAAATPRVEAAGDDLDACLARLDSESRIEREDAQEAVEARARAGLDALREAIRLRRLGLRGRRHAVWIRAHVEGPAAVAELLDAIRDDPEPSVQAQAVRAVADLTDPILTRHRLDAGPGDADLAARLAGLAEGQDPRVVLEVVIALGRLGWRDATRWLRTALADPDPALAHAAMQTLRRSGNATALLEALDEPDPAPMRGIALRAIADQYQPELVDGMIARLEAERHPGRRREYGDLLTRVAKTSGPRPYWGYRPPPRPANTVRWERTDAIERALNRVLADPDRAVRLAVLRRMQREQVATSLEVLAPWLRSESDPAAVAAIVESLREHPADRTRGLLEALIGDGAQTASNRREALALWIAGLGEGGADRLLDLGGALEEGPLLASVLREIGARPALRGASALIPRLTAADAGVRAAAVEALAALRVAEAGEPVRALLGDPDASVRRAASAAVGQFRDRAAIPALRALARDADPAVRAASLDSLRLLRDPGGVPLALAALSDRATQGPALRGLEDLGDPDHFPAVVAMATRQPPTEVLLLAVRVLSDWGRRDGLPESRRREIERAVAEVQGTTGLLARWHVAGPLDEAAIAPRVEGIAAPSNTPAPPGGGAPDWSLRFAAGGDSRLRLGPTPASSVWLAWTDLDAPESGPVQLLASSNGRLRIWSNGRLVYRRDEVRPFAPDSDRFDGMLERGTNRLVVAVSAPAGAAEFHLRFRRRGSTAERERLLQLALSRPGNAERGRATFLNVEKSQCLKCHRFREGGGAIGPDLTGIGGRFPRAYLAESILEPSRTIAPSFETVLVALHDGRVLAGVPTSETQSALTLADRDGRQHVVTKADIEARRPEPSSLMPDGLEKQLTADEFVDLVAFLAGEK